MKVKFTSSIDDFIYVATQINNRNPAGSDILAYGYLFFVAANVVGFGVLFIYSVHYLAGLLILSANLFAFSFFLSNVNKSYYRNFYGNILSDDNHRQMEIELNEKGICCRCGNGDESVTSWKSVKSVEETEESIYFFTICNGIPVRREAFKSRDALEEFMTFAKSRVKLNAEV